jgi:hypothetical protein
MTIQDILNELRTTQSPQQPVMVPSNSLSVATTSNPTVNTVIVSDTNSWVPFLFGVLALIAVVLMIIAYKMYCAPKEKEQTGDARFPPDVQKYLANKTGKVMAWLKPEPFFVPDSITESDSIPVNKIDPHIALSWTRLSDVMETGRKRAGSELRRKSTWNMKQAHGLNESTPSIPIQWYGAFSPGEDLSALFKDSDTYTMSHIASSTDDPECHVITLESSWKNYVLVVHQSCVENIVILSNAPDMQTFSNYSWKSYDDLPTHSLHTRISTARLHVDEYNQTDMNQEATPHLKTILDNFKNANALLNTITVVKKGLNDAKNRLKT